MKKKAHGIILTVACLALALNLAACGGGEKSPAASETGEHAKEEGSHHAKEGETGHEDSEGGHKHGNVEHKLGEAAAGKWTVSATQMDDAVAGGEQVYYIKVGGDAAEPAAIRLWVGDDQASYSVKELAHPLGERRHHAHVQIPAELKKGDRFHVELEDAEGALTTARFALPAGAVHLKGESH